MEDYSKYSDMELADMLREENHDAFAEIYQRFHSLLYIHAFRRLDDQEATNDLLQDIFIQLWEKRNVLMLHGSLSAYLYSSVRNKIINQYVHKKVEGKYLSSLGDYFEEDHRYADFRVRENQLKSLIESEIAALPETERLIFHMSRNENLSYREIAEKLDLTEEAVKSKMKRTLKVLRGKLGLWGYLVLLWNFF